MPKIKPLVRDPVKKRHKATEKIIRKAMVDMDLQRYEDAGALIGMSRQMFSRHLRNNTWTLDQAASLVKALHLSPENAAVMLGAKSCST